MVFLQSQSRLRRSLKLDVVQQGFSDFEKRKCILNMGLIEMIAESKGGKDDE